MKKMFKKSIACLVAVLMIASSLPFTTLTAQAATQTATVSSYNVFKGDETNNRFNKSSKILKICNDNTRENFTIGFVNFDVSNISCSSSDIVSANYTFTVSMDSNCKDNEGLAVYYPLINTDDFLNYTKSSTCDTTGSYLGAVSSTSYNAIYTGGSGTTNIGADFIGNTKTNYMLQQIAEYDTNPDTATSKTIDIGPAVKAAKLAGKNTATICFMLKNAGDTDQGSKGWSDTSVTVSSTSVTVNTNSANYSSTKSNINSKINQTKTFGSDVYKNNADSNYMKGVKISGDLADESQRNISNCDFRVTGFANQVAVYTGSGSDIRFPFMARNVGNKASNVAFFVDYVSFSNSTFAVGGSKWTRCNAWNNYSSNSDTSHDFSSVEGTTRDNKYFTANEEKEWKNYITYIGSGNTTNYYDSLSSIAFKTRVGYNGTRSTATVYNYNASLYVINYAPVKALIESTDFKTKYNNISANESIYETTSLTNYYNAVNNLLNFEVLNGITASNASTTVPQKGEKIKELLEAYDNAVNALTYNYTFKRTDNTSVVVSVKDENSAKKWGITYKNASNSADSAKTYKSNKQHAWNSYTWTSTASNYVFTEIATEHTEDCTVSAGGICSICKEQLLDLTAYDDAHTEMDTIAVNSFEYEPTSHAKYLELAKAAVAIKENATTQKEVDEATAQLLAAKSVLRKSKCTVTVIAYDKDGNKSYEEAIEDVEYGSAKDIDIVTLTSNAVKGVEKWTITTDGGKTVTRLNTLDTSVTLYVTKDVTITAYASDEASDSTSSKVVFLGKNGRVIAVKYLAANEPLSTSTVAIPSIPFYDQSKWDTDSVTADGSGKTIYVRAEYSCTSTDDMCTVHFNGKTKKYSYDSYVRPEGIDPKKQYALAKDAEGKNILTYLNGVDFYAPKTSDIYVVEVTNREAKIAITGSFSQRITEGGKDKRAATFNCKFYLPDDCTLVEWGAEISANGRTQVVKGESISSGNEYSITMKTILPASSLTAFTGVAYVTYKTADNQTVTIKSESVEQVLVD